MTQVANDANRKFLAAINGTRLLRAESTGAVVVDASLTISFDRMTCELGSISKNHGNCFFLRNDRSCDLLPLYIWEAIIGTTTSINYLPSKFVNEPLILG